MAENSLQFKGLPAEGQTRGGGREVVKPGPWAEGDFEEKMAMLLRWANALNRSDPAFAQAQSLLEAEESSVGRVIRCTKAHAGQNV